MARLNFRDIRDRFTHIDAEFVSCDLGFGGATPRYTVRFYPWWEHPAYSHARMANRPWGFHGATQEGAREVTVYPIRLVECRVSTREIVVDWSFFDSHPLLWPYEDNAEIFCNSECSVSDLASRVAAKAQVSRTNLYRYLDPLLSRKPPFCLGRVPFSLFNTVQEELAAMGVATFIPRVPQIRGTPVVLLIDGDDYIIAEDFEVDFPVFEHKAEWFKES